MADFTFFYISKTDDPGGTSRHVLLLWISSTKGRSAVIVGRLPCSPPGEALLFHVLASPPGGRGGCGYVRAAPN